MNRVLSWAFLVKIIINIKQVPEQLFSSCGANCVSWNDEFAFVLLWKRKDGKDSFIKYLFPTFSL